MDIKTIEQEVNNTIVVEKSKFISYAFSCSNKDEIDEILAKLSKQYYDATHICYAYILYDGEKIIYKSNDDGEPSNTAGAPILNVIKKNELVNVLCVVVRYFGGIKLGAGGLTRTYTTSAADVISKAKVITLKDAYLYLLSFPYDRIKDIDKVIENNQLVIQKKNYDMKVSYELIFNSKEQAENFIQKYCYLNIEGSFLSEIKIKI